MGNDTETKLLERVFGRLTVIEYAGEDAGRHRFWVCECECGNLTTVRQNNLLSGDTQSCGCLNRERVRAANTVHGHARPGKETPTYRSWASMLSRCGNPTDASYRNYGGRGIGVCERWHQFANFLQDMGERPDEECSIDRISNDGDYELGNCKWSTRSEQNRNRGDNHLVEFDGRTQCLMTWAEEFGLKYATLSSRLRYGWSIERALTTPVARGE